MTNYIAKFKILEKYSIKTPEAFQQHLRITICAKNITKFLIAYLYRNDRFQHGYCINIRKKIFTVVLSHQ